MSPASTHDTTTAERNDTAEPFNRVTNQDTATDSGRLLAETVDLTDRQRVVLGCVAENLTTPQTEIGERLGIVASTVCNRVSSIPGSEWSDRADLADAMLEPAGPSEASDNTDDGEDAVGVAESAGTDDTAEPEPASDSPVGQTVEASTDGGTTQPADATLTETDRTTAALETQIEELTDHVAAVEDRLAEQQATKPESVFEEPELVHKLVHAAMESDRITEDEELALLREML